MRPLGGRFADGVTAAGSATSVEGLAAILGGAYDLGGALKRHAPRLRYVRVTTRAYWEAAREAAP